jgi:hypothetical protein
VVVARPLVNPAASDACRCSGSRWQRLALCVVVHVTFTAFYAVALNAQRPMSRSRAGEVIPHHRFWCACCRGCCGLRNWVLYEDFIHQCRQGVLVYVVIRVSPHVRVLRLLGGPLAHARHACLLSPRIS